MMGFWDAVFDTVASAGPYANNLHLAAPDWVLSLTLNE